MFLQYLTSSAVLLLLARLATPVTAAVPSGGWHFDEVYTLVTEQLDPIVNPNAQGTHMHRVIGGSNFRAAYSFDAARSGSCSTVGVQGDKSNYWMPQLYGINDGGKSFTPIGVATRFYYFIAPNNDVDPVVQFPDGLRILSGNPNSKTANPNNYAYVCQVGQTNRDQDVTRSDFNFDIACPRGIKTNLYLPNCWNGKDLWLPGGAHMAPTAAGSYRGGSCPWSHPIKLPSIMLEYAWYTHQWKDGATAPLKGKLAWANGDTTGYGIHGDFTNGWDRSLLARAMADKSCTSGSVIGAHECSIFSANMDVTKARNCKPDAGVLAERAGNGDGITIATLPGCNPLWGNTPNKPTCSSPAPQYDISRFKATDGSMVAVSSQRRDRPIPSSAGWIPLGCVKETGSFIDAKAYLWPKNLTQDGCMKRCATDGKKFAAVGNHADNCICSNGIKDSAPVMTGLCTAPCPGNSAQTCGTAYAFNVYGAGPGTTASSPAKPVNVVRSFEEDPVEVEVEKRSGWKAMLGSGQGKMIKRADRALD
ncbi:hypothetical protein HD553DRAFT_125501 [Filobasidium floriforme]|uniref:uncharacterized protein n=1 Tax=Filobasidium floriforme TaxID=5210 RepID=UPI001E8DD713|nr:uncharacterized protein HD553DRAFT_125501 [Filobasidium floriforme]KAH8079917.1 hypothetical protein HD553DRAFT_125501 [Filobasidium floriforme]